MKFSARKLLLTMIGIIATTCVMAQDTIPGSDSVVDYALKASPYNSISYGLLIIGSWFMVWVFYKNWKEAEKNAREVSDHLLDIEKEVLQMLIKVEIRLSDQKKDTDNIREIIGKITSMESYLKENRDIFLKVLTERSNI